MYVTDKENNVKFRQLFHAWYREHFEPNKKLVAQAIGIPYNTFRQWVSGSIDMSFEKLCRVQAFLNKYDFEMPKNKYYQYS